MDANNNDNGNNADNDKINLLYNIKDEFNNLILLNIINKNDMNSCIIIGKISEDLVVKISDKNNKKWLEIKMEISGYNKNVSLKLFDDDASDAFNKYTKGDVLLVIGEPNATGYLAKSNKVISRLDIFPYFVKKINHTDINNIKNKKIILV